MAHFTPPDYDRLERAIEQGRRIVFTRHGREVVVVPTRLRYGHGREVVEARHPTTGDTMTFVLEEIDGFEVVSW
jgi:hypothetical protein